MHSLRGEGSFYQNDLPVTRFLQAANLKRHIPHAIGEKPGMFLTLLEGALEIKYCYSNFTL
jgi:hypothetical protein